MNYPCVRKNKSRDRRARYIAEIGGKQAAGRSKLDAEINLLVLLATGQSPA